MITKDIGFILRRYNFRETSLITTLYTCRFGKIKGIFKGFYTSKKEFASSLDIFSLNELVFYPKRSEIWLISHADLISDYSFLRQDLSKAKIAGLFFNLIDKTTELWDSNFEIFTLVSSCFNLLKEERGFKVFYIFLIKFLTLSGFSPELKNCVCCKEKVNARQALFSVSKGGLVCRNCSPKAAKVRKISPQALQSFLYIQSTEFPLVLRLSLSPVCEKELFSILKDFYAYRFGFDAGLDMV